MFFQVIKRAIKDFIQLRKGQTCDYKLLMEAHRIEKGLSHISPKAFWGWEKAYSIAKLLKTSVNSFSNETASAVLSAYLSEKKNNPEEKENYYNFLNKTGFKEVYFNGIGGWKIIDHNEVSFSEKEKVTIYKLFTSRFSSRNFKEEKVPIRVIEQAIEMASNCPSACNRQPYKVYVCDSTKIADLLGYPLQYNCPQTLIITGDVRAFDSYEFNDWIISPVIFAAYLSLSFHALGVGNCIIRKDLVANSVYNTQVSQYLELSESQRIVLEICIGYSDDERVPLSKRKSVSDIMCVK